MVSRKYLVASLAILFAVDGIRDLAASEGGIKSPKLFIEGDIVQGQLCVLNSRFKANDRVVWRMRVRDAKTGNVLDASALKSVVVELGDGQKFPMKFGGHPRGGTDDYFWATAWTIPADYPTGTMTYKVMATDTDGDVTEWEPFKIKSSQLTIVQ